MTAPTTGGIDRIEVITSGSGPRLSMEETAWNVQETYAPGMTGPGARHIGLVPRTT